MRFILNEKEDPMELLPLEDGSSQEFLDELHKQKEENEKAYNKYVDEVNKIIDDVNKDNTKVLKEKLFLEEDEIDEALPRDLAKAFKHPDRPKKNNWKVPYAYGNIDRTFPDIDFDKSEYTEITPQEAVDLKNSGHPEEILMVYADGLITFRPDGKQIYRVDRNYNNHRKYPNLFTRPNGDVVDSTTKLTFKTLANTAQKIYRKKEVTFTPGYRQSKYPGRGETPESPRYGHSNIPTYPIGDKNADNPYLWYDHNTSKIRAAGSNNPFLSDQSRAKSRKSNIRSYSNTIKECNDRIAELTAQLKEIKAEISKSYNYTEDEVNEYAARIKRIQEQIAAYIRSRDQAQASLDAYKNPKPEYERKDARARWKDANSEFYFRNLYKEYKKIKNEVSRLYDEISDAQARRDNLVNNGSPKARRMRSDIADYRAEIQRLTQKILDLETMLAEIDEDEEVKKVDDEIAGLENTLGELTAKLNKMTGKSTITEDLDTLTDDGDYQQLKPDGHLAKKIYALIVGSGKLEELAGVIRELFPEGISLTGLWDIFNFDPFFILDELGIEPPEELLSTEDETEESTEEETGEETGEEGTEEGSEEGEPTGEGDEISNDEADEE